MSVGASLRLASSPHTHRPICSCSSAHSTLSVRCRPHRLSHATLAHNAVLSERSAFLGSSLTQHIGEHWRGQQHRLSGSGLRRLQVQASFFGVGAPEAVLVGIVALVIFGPQGLAEAAKTAGKTVRAFRPTFDELAGVSRDLRSTLDKELGIDEIRREFTGSPYSSGRGTQPDWDDMGTTAVKSSAAEKEDPDIEAKRAQAAQTAWDQSAAEPKQPQSGGGVPESGEELNDVSLEELQSELAARKAARKDA